MGDPDLSADQEQQIASMSEGEWSAFVAKHRAPDTAEAFRTIAAQHVSGAKIPVAIELTTTSVTESRGAGRELSRYTRLSSIVNRASWVSSSNSVCFGHFCGFGPRAANKVLSIADSSPIQNVISSCQRFC